MTGEVKGRDCLISVYPFCAFYLLVRSAKFCVECSIATDLLEASNLGSNKIRSTAR
jgi:hypothetical protein